MGRGERDPPRKNDNEKFTAHILAAPVVCHFGHFPPLMENHPAQKPSAERGVLSQVAPPLMEKIQ